MLCYTCIQFEMLWVITLMKSLLKNLMAAQYIVTTCSLLTLTGIIGMQCVQNHVNKTRQACNCPGQEKVESSLSKWQSGIQFFFHALLVLLVLECLILTVPLSTDCGAIGRGVRWVRLHSLMRRKGLLNLIGGVKMLSECRKTGL